MAIAIKINFEDIYKPDNISDDLKITKFTTELQTGTTQSLKVAISNEAHELLPDTYNLAFGPLKANGDIDDKAELTHKDYSKVFSTILLSAFTYLKENPGHLIGIDGSDNNRAHLYYKFLQRNYDYLSKYFKFFGIKYYVRISRLGKRQYDDPFNFEDIQSAPVEIEKGKIMPPDEMYNYFTFRLKKGKVNIPF
jgi:hypothetical protein